MTVFRDSRTGKWIAKPWVNGKYGARSSHATKKEAREEERRRSGIRAASVSVEEFCETWLTDYARPAKSSQRSYRYSLEPFRKEFGHRKLASIERPEAQRWAKRVKYQQYRTVRTMYADATRDGLVAFNPFASLRIAVPRGRRKLVPLTEDQVIALADKALEQFEGPMGGTMRALVLTAGFTGLRSGELGALRWKNVGEDRITVERSLSAEGQLRLPKNGHVRVAVMPLVVRDALADAPRYMSDWVFQTPRGTQFTKGIVHWYFSQLRSAYGKPKLQFHELRHACATLLLERGLSPQDVALQLGHTDGGRLVMALYGHPAEDLARERIAMAFGE